MLHNIYVKNLALIDEIEVELNNGLNILTGETGAGKSIILGSINLPPSARLIEPRIMDFPAPVSPVKILRPSPNSTSASSIKARFFTYKFFNMVSHLSPRKAQKQLRRQGRTVG